MDRSEKEFELSERHWFHSPRPAVQMLYPIFVGIDGSWNTCL
jgi:hypothetical protein